MPAGIELGAREPHLLERAVGLPRLQERRRREPVGGDREEAGVELRRERGGFGRRRARPFPLPHHRGDVALLGARPRQQLVVAGALDRLLGRRERLGEPALALQRVREPDEHRQPELPVRRAAEVADGVRVALAHVLREGQVVGGVGELLVRGGVDDRDRLLQRLLRGGELAERAVREREQRPRDGVERILRRSALRAGLQRDVVGLVDGVDELREVVLGQRAEPGVRGGVTAEQVLAGGGRGDQALVAGDQAQCLLQRAARVLEPPGGRERVGERDEQGTAAVAPEPLRGRVPARGDLRPGLLGGFDEHGDRLLVARLRAAFEVMRADLARGRT